MEEVETAATNEQIRDEFRDSLPRQVHRSETLPKHSKLWPCGIFDEVSRVEEYEVQRCWEEFDIKPGLAKDWH